VKTTATWIGLVIGVAALILQISITVPLRMSLRGDTVIGAVVFYFSFFTILTNLTLVFVYASELWPRQWLSWVRRPTTRGMMVGVIILVMIFNHFFLRLTFTYQGLPLLADFTLHYITPVVYVAWWIVFMRHGILKFSDIPGMLLPPIIYLTYVMIRGAIIGEYPYAILEANRLGYPTVAINVLAVLVGLTVLCATTVAIDKALTRVDMPGP